MLNLIPNFISWGFCIAVAIQFSHCKSPSQRKEENTSNFKKADTVVPGKPPSSFPDTLIIRSSAAVLYEPDSVQLLNLRAITDSGVFAATLHEYEYQIKTSIAYFAKYRPELPVIHARQVRFLHFVQQNQKDTIIDLNKNGDAYGLYLFRNGYPPYKVEMTNIDTEVPSYFSDQNVAPTRSHK